MASQGSTSSDSSLLCSAHSLLSTVLPSRYTATRPPGLRQLLQQHLIHSTLHVGCCQKMCSEAESWGAVGSLLQLLMPCG